MDADGDTQAGRAPPRPRRRAVPPWRDGVRWAALPWRPTGQAVVLVLATALPALLVVAAAGWERGARDTVAASLAAELTPLEAGLEVAAEGSLTPAALAAADAAIREALDRTGDLDEPDRTIATATLRATVLGDERPLPVPLRLVARDGARDAVTTVTTADPASLRPGTDASRPVGVWVSTWVADELGVSLGDELRFDVPFVADPGLLDPEDPEAPTGVVVSGIYEQVWDEQRTPPSGYWAEVPPEILPVWIGPIREPTAALVLLEEADLAASGLPGTATWRARAPSAPITYAGLRGTDERYERVRTDVVTDTTLGRALAGLTGGPPARVVTGLSDVAEQARTAVALLGSPIASARALGVGLGLVIAVAGGGLLAVRHRTLYALLAAEGDRRGRLAARTAVLLAPPAVVGAAVGVGIGRVVAATAGPVATVRDAPVPLGEVLVVTLLAIAGGATLAGALGVRAGEASGEVGSARAAGAVAATALAALAGTAALLWVLAGRDVARGGGVDATVVALPVAVLALAALCAVAGAGRVLRLVIPLVGPTRPLAFLVVRRLAHGRTGLPLVAVGLAVAVGLVGFSSTIARTAATTVEAKVATSIAGTSRLTLLPRPLDTGRSLPPATTWLATSDSRLAGTNDRLRVVAVDPASWEGAVRWPSTFGPTQAEVTALLQRDLDGTLAAVAVQGEPTPSTGAFGVGTPYAFEVVGTAAAAPLAGELPRTIIVSSTALDRVATDRFRAGLVAEGVDPVEAATARPELLATDRFRRHLVSDLPVGALTSAVAGWDLEIAESVSAAGRTADPDVVATGLAFDFVRVVGLAALVAAIVALALLLAVQRRHRALAALLLRRMGLTERTERTAVVVELVVLVGLSAGVALATAPLLAARLAPRFDPLPGLPPEVAVDVPVEQLAIAGLGVVLAASVLALAVTSTARRPAAEVLRGDA